MAEGRAMRRAADRPDMRAKIDIGRKVDFLSRAESYPEQPSRVATVETHYSWVFLTDCHAYKLKKPVRGEGFDFRSLAARRDNAVAELRLNRRLAADVYLGIVPLTLQANGKLAVGGCGRPVDWLIRMARLEAEHMFDRRLACGDWHYGQIEALAHRLAAFFAAARPAQVSAPRMTARLAAEIRTAAVALSAPDDRQLLTAAKPVCRRLDAVMVRRAALFRRRIRERRIVDGHGDLRPEHIYLRGTPRVIDCLEFRLDLRQLDPVNELAYLALECRRLGGPAIERSLLRRYRERTGDRPPPELMRFYAALNALVRARIAIRHLAEPGPRPPQEWIARTRAYIAVAAREVGFISR